MHRKTLVLMLIAGLFSASTAIAEQDIETQIMKSRMTIKTFGKTLKGELVAAMKAGGPINAIGVCNTEAPKIASKVSLDQAMSVSRTSLKNRNSSNAPSDWQAAVLEQFEADKMSGKMPNELEFSEIVDTNAGKEFRYMKAIPTGEVCLKCHGSTIDAKVTAKLSELYPQDKATGFSEGDLRGAFVVTKILE